MRGTIGSPGSNNSSNTSNEGLNDGKSGGKQCNVKDQNIGRQATQNSTQQQHPASTSASTVASAGIPENHHHYPNSTSEKAACKSMSTPAGNRISSFGNKAAKKRESTARFSEGNTEDNVLRFVGTSPCTANASQGERLKPPDRGRDDCAGANSIKKSASSSTVRSLTSSAAASLGGREDTAKWDHQNGRRREIDGGRSRLKPCTNQCNNLQTLPSECDGVGAAAVSEGIPPAGSAITCTSTAGITKDTNSSDGANSIRAGIGASDLIPSDNECNTLMEGAVKHARESNMLLGRAERVAIHTGEESREWPGSNGQRRRWSEGNHRKEAPPAGTAMPPTYSPSPERQAALPSSEGEWSDNDCNNRISSSLPRTHKTSHALSPLQDFFGSADRKHSRSTSEEMSRKSSLPCGSSDGSTTRNMSHTGMKSPIARAVEHNRCRSQSADSTPYPATTLGGPTSLSSGTMSSNAPAQSPALKRRFLSVKERAQAFLHKATAASSAGRQQQQQRVPPAAGGPAIGNNVRVKQNHGPSLSPSLSKSASAACNINTSCSNSSGRMPSNHIIGLMDNGVKAKAADRTNTTTAVLSSSLAAAVEAGSNGSIDWNSSTPSRVKALSVKTDTYREKCEAAAVSCSQRAFRTASPSQNPYVDDYDRNCQRNINAYNRQQYYDCDLKRINRNREFSHFSGAKQSNSCHSGLYSVVDITSPGAVTSKLRKNFSSLSEPISEQGTNFGLNDDDVFLDVDDDVEVSHAERMDFEEDGAACLVHHSGHSCVTTHDRHNGEFTGQSVTDMEVIYDEPYADVDVDEQCHNVVGGGAMLVEGGHFCDQCSDSTKDSNSVTADDDTHVCEYANCGGSHHSKKRTGSSSRERSSSGGRKAGQYAMQIAAVSGAATMHACHNMHVHQKHHVNQGSRAAIPQHHHHQQQKHGNKIGAMDRRYKTSSDSISIGSSGSGKFRDSSSGGGISAASSDRNSTGDVHMSPMNSLERLQKHQQHSLEDSLQALNKHHHNVTAVNHREFVRQISAPASVMTGGQRPSFNSPSCGIRMAEMRAASKRHNSSPHYYTLDPEYIMNTSGGSSGSNKTSPVYCEITGFERSPSAMDNNPGGGTPYELLNYSEPKNVSAPTRSNQHQDERPPLPPRDYRLSDEYKPLSVQTAQHQAVLAASASSSRQNTPSPQRHSSPSPVRPYPNLGLISARRASHDSCTLGAQSQHLSYYTPLIGGGAHSSTPSPSALSHHGAMGVDQLSCEVVGVHGAAAAAVSNILNLSPHPVGAAPSMSSPSSSRHSSGSRGVQANCIIRDMISSPDSGKDKIISIAQASLMYHCVTTNEDYVLLLQWNNLAYY